jgi:hypothetical protein
VIELITMEEARAHLRVTGTRADEDIQLKIIAAGAILLNYIKVDQDESPLSMPWGAEDVPWDIKAATMLILGELFAERESGKADVLSQAVKSLLHRYRDPAMA